MALTDAPRPATRPRAPIWVRSVAYGAALCLVGLGVATMVQADLGLAPNDVMNTGLAEVLDIGVGTAAWLTAVVAMLLAWAAGRRPRLATVLGGAVVGVAINTALAVVPEADGTAAQVAYLVAGLAVVWTGITFVVSTDVGAGPLELLMLALMDRGVGIRVARWGMEIALLAIGLVLGGAAGWGTALFALGTGPVLAVTLPWATALLGTTLHEPIDVVAAAS